MFQNNPLLAQLKQQFNEKAPRVEGIVKRNEKGFGFLESDNKKSFFIPPQQMKKVMGGDRIIAMIQSNNGKDFVEPETLVQPFLTRFIARIEIKEGKFFAISDHPVIKEIIPCKINASITQSLQREDWVVANLIRHPLKDSNSFAEVVEFIANSHNSLAPWLVALSRNNLEKKPPNIHADFLLANEESDRQDLTHLDFITIDNQQTEDMDDAIYIEEESDGNFMLSVAVADPTAYIAEGTDIDNIAKTRCFTNYLPGFNIPMLPRELSDDLCSLQPKQKRPALVCKMKINAEGDLTDTIIFENAWIESKAKLSYDNVSNFLDNTGDIFNERDEIKQQVLLLQQLAEKRNQYRSKTVLTLNNRPDYHFILNDEGKLLDVIIEPRRIAHRMVEEAMIVANIALAKVLGQKIGIGIFNTHAGFDTNHLSQIVTLLAENDQLYNEQELITLDAFCRLKKELDVLPSHYLDFRLRRFQSHAELSLHPLPHFGLGLQTYATWTSPIRRYSDMINHRLIKQWLANKPIEDLMLTDDILVQINERRKACRFAEKEISDWLYCDFLQDKIGSLFLAEILDINRGGMRIKLIDNGASAFIPVSLLHDNKAEIVCQQDVGIIKIKDEISYRLGDIISVAIKEIRKENRNIIAKLADVEIS